jgi:hypothetical protein
MAQSIPTRRGWIRNFQLFLGVAVLTIGTQAQQGTVHTSAAPKQRPLVMMRIRNSSASPGMPAARSNSASVARAGMGTRLITARSLFVAPQLTGAKIAAFLPPGSSEGRIFEPGFVRPFFLSPFWSGLGLPGSVSGFGAIPFGFGLWPACDAAGTQGVFWTVGPCFGAAGYTEEATASEAPAATYLRPLVLFEAPEASGRAGIPNPSAQSAPTMLLYLTDGMSIAAADWWVAEGRLQYVTDAGTKGVLDLTQLDLEQTIKQNQKRGLEFHLRFTPPSERP